MAMPLIPTKIAEIQGCDPAALSADILTSTQPLVLKGLVKDWPIVAAGKESIAKAAEYLGKFYNGTPITVYHGAPENQGRVFYNDDLSGFNYQPLKADLRFALSKFQEHAADEQPPTIYVGSTLVDFFLPGFRAENDLSIGATTPLISVWISNQCRIAAHYDFPDNIACSVVGKRRFTLFPPDQLSNLYVGPLDVTPAGQPVSLVDFYNPDFERFPKFREALAHAQVAELEPGDAIFIPSMWWHHVESLDKLNVLVNYWWRQTPAFMGPPINALTHAMLAIRDLPDVQRKAWKDIFSHYVFDFEPDHVAHIPEHSRGSLNPIDEMSARKIRALLLNKLNN